MRLPMFALLLVVTPTFAAPIPKSVEAEKKKEYERLKEEYDKKIAESEGTSQGVELALDIEIAKTMAKEVAAESKNPTPEQLKVREARGQARGELFKQSPRLRELFIIYHYEMTHSR